VHPQQVRGGAVGDTIRVGSSMHPGPCRPWEPVEIRKNVLALLMAPTIILEGLPMFSCPVSSAQIDRDAGVKTSPKETGEPHAKRLYDRVLCCTCVAELPFLFWFAPLPAGDNSGESV